MGGDEHYHSTRDEVRTPPCVLDPIYEHFGPIGLDPFYHPEGLVVAERYISLEVPRALPDDVIAVDREGYLVGTGRDADATDYQRIIQIGDGMTDSWDGHGLVFANGPWSKLRCDRPKEFTSWAQKGAQEGDEVILLVPSRTGSEMWQRFVTPADVILFWRGRMKFWEEKDAAPFHVALVYWGHRPELMEKAYGNRHWRVVNAGD